MLSAKNITKNYTHLQVLKGVDLEVHKGEVLSIVGSSGAGKSTLLHILGTLDRPDNGTLEINGTNLNKLSQNKLATFRNKNIGFVFQFHHLLPEFTALENTCVPGWIAGKNKKQVKDRAIEILTKLGLQDRLEHKPGKLSGGEQQRVAVARALINNPLLIMADEPTGNLDSNNAAELHQLFLDLRKEYEQTFIIATHNKELADMCDRKLTMEDGVLTGAAI